MLGQPGAFGPASLRDAVAHCAYPLMLVAAVGALAVGLGARLLQAAAVTSDFSETLALSLGLGAGTLASALFLLGLTGLLKPLPIAGILIAAAFYAAPSLARLWSRRRGLVLDSVSWVSAGLILYSLCSATILALAPPTDADVMAYHLVLPKLYVQTGRIGELPWLLFSHWPHLMETSSALFLLLNSDLAAALWHVAGTCAFLALVYHLGRRHIGRTWGWAAAAVVAAQPVVARFAGTARIDGWLALFILSAHHCAWRWSEERRRGWLLVAGVMAGFAAAAKLIGVIPLVLIAGWIALLANRGSRRPWRDATFFAAAGLTVVGPWYVKTWVGTGNPVWPFLYPFLGGRWNPDAFLSAYLKSTRLPLPFTWDGLTHYDPEYVILALLVAAAWLWLRDKERQRIPAFFVFLFVSSIPYAALLVPQLEFWRFFIPYFPALALPLAWCMSRLARRDRLSIALNVALFATAIAPIATLSQANELFAVLEVRSAMFPGQPPRQVYLTRAFEPYPFFQAANARLSGKPVKVLLFALSEGYYLDLPYEWGTSWYQGVLSYGAMKTSDDLADRLKRRGFTHILFDRSRLSSEDQQAQKLMGEVLERDGKAVLRDGKYALYELDWGRTPQPQTTAARLAR